MNGKLILNTIAFADLWKNGGAQAEFVSMSADMGFDGIEIRSELLRKPEQECLQIGELARHCAIETYYSVNDAMIQGAQLNPQMEKYFKEVALLGATHIKFNVGDVSTYQGDLKRDLRAAGSFDACEINVENNQSLEDSRLENVEHFFSLVSKSGADVGFCFDLANWYWTGSDPAQAAESLAAVTRYIHLKSKVEKEGKKRVTSLAEGEIAWREVLKKFQPGLPMALEYAAAKEILLKDLELLRA